MTKVYYEFIREPQPWFPPANTQLAKEEYRGFLISRANVEYVFFEIQNLDGSVPIIPLQGSFTKKDMAKKTIDTFLLSEALKQAKAESEQ